MRPGAAFCGQCFAVPGESVPGKAAPSRAVPSPDGLRFVATYSRWRKTDSTFGPMGRSVWTVLVVLVMAMAVFSQNPFAIGPLCLIGAPLVLRSVWAKGRVT